MYVISDELRILVGLNADTNELLERVYKEARHIDIKDFVELEERLRKPEFQNPDDWSKEQE